MKDKFLKIYEKINWSIILFVVFLLVLFFNLNLYIALTFYLIVIFLDGIVMYLTKQKKGFIISVVSALVLGAIMLLFL
ncbi:hypothetical protein [Listeria fleischmannii]|uniref:Uncharacterized protein n=1 Tax=Listeria fleischmannii TaxID=1069827 RepID=A0A841YDI4_9LIST|nr:hypothetical protein [Listeria fleischmannii]EIA19769.1 hypothetical protein KKC_10557 [Listeria fleischmannii subsp. coloradonensis]MBC1398385.1 hypothetical protein [Listeria fleischmannii]MBC1419582.1 hypothetical protein [Listeria fleischmannii]MBC1426446.1 hypothetical protein [Listeria fleischmannii]